MKQLITYVGLDVHKETIAVALAEAGLRGDVRDYGKIANTPTAVRTWLRSWHAMVMSCGSATKPAPAATAFSDN